MHALIIDGGMPVTLTYIHEGNAVTERKDLIQEFNKHIFLSCLFIVQCMMLWLGDLLHVDVFNLFSVTKTPCNLLTLTA